MNQTQIELGKLYFRLKSKRDNMRKQAQYLQERINEVDDMITEIDMILCKDMTHVFEHFEEVQDE